MRFTAATLAALALAGAAPAAAWSPAPEDIRVAIARDRASITVAGPVVQVYHVPGGGEGEPELVQTTANKLKVAFNKQGLILGRRATAHRRLVFVSETGALRIDGKELHGPVEIAVSRGGKRLVAVNQVDLEKYVEGVIAGELPPSWPLEAIKAQAVAARSFALFRKIEREGADYDMEATVIDQVFDGHAKVSNDVREAVRATRGEVLTYAREPVRANFHACAGGITEDSAAAFGDDVPYLVSRKSPDGDCARSSWTLALSPAELGEALAPGSGQGPVTALRPVARSRTGRVTRIEYSQDGAKRALTGNRLRELLGYDKLFSLLFTVEKQGGKWVFTGRGSGHGVGMSQWGARALANTGKSYDHILRHYYRKTKVEKIY